MIPKNVLWTEWLWCAWLKKKTLACVCECLEEMMMTRKILYGISGKFLLCWHEYVSRSFPSPAVGIAEVRRFTKPHSTPAPDSSTLPAENHSHRDRNLFHIAFFFLFLSQKHNQRSEFGEIFTDFAAKASWRWGVWWTLNSLATQIARARHRNLIRFVGTTRIFLISWHFQFGLLSMKLTSFTYKDTEIQESGLNFMSSVLQSVAFLTQFADNLTNLMKY